MLVVLATSHRDIAGPALKNAQWLVSLQHRRDHHFIVAVNQRGQHLAQPVIDTLKEKFSRVDLFVPYDEEEREWPFPQNHMFDRVARFIKKQHDQYWFWLESDAWALRDFALDDLEDDHIASKCSFSGMLVDTRSPVDGKPIPKHMSGIGIYPKDVFKHAMRGLEGGTAFDMVLADSALQDFNNTPLIHHVYQCPEFEKDEDLNMIRPGAAIFHQSKSGSICDILANKTGWKPRFLRPNAKPITPAADSPKAPQAMITDILIKTYPSDFEWLKYCLFSIDRFASGFRQVVIVSPEQLPFPTRHRVIVEPDAPGNGYLHQQVVKLHAFRYSDADQFLFMDSDCIFTREVHPGTFMREDKPIWLKTPWTHVKDQNARDAWYPCMTNFLGKQPVFEFMRRHPFLIPTWFLKEMDASCRLIHDKDLATYVMETPNFSEFNCAGGLAHTKKFHDRFFWIDTTKDEVPPLTVLQHHSYHGLNEEIKAKLEAVLQPPSAAPASVVETQSGPVKVIETKEVVPASTHPTQPQSWGEETDLLVRRLKELCTAPVHIGNLRKKLAAAGLIDGKKKAKA